MKRRSKVSGGRAKSRNLKATKRKRGSASDKALSSASPHVSAQAELARLTRELTDERRQRRATSEVLRLLSGSHGDLNHLFDTILANATNLCQANFGTLSLCEGDAFRIVAMHNVPSGLAELRRREPLVRAGPLLRMAETKRLLHIADYTEYVASHPADTDAAAFSKLTGVRTTLEVPMLKEDDVVGAIVIYRKEVRRFDDREMALIKDFAAQAVIAIENARLLNELRQRTGDLTEALEQQTATSEVLKVISSSPGNLEPVFATMLENAVRICEAKFGNIYRWDGDAFNLVTTHNTPPALAAARKRSPIRPDPKAPAGRMVATKTVVHIADLATDPGYIEHRVPAIVAAVELGGIRTLLTVPMLKEHELVGALTVYRQEVRLFTEKQIELLTSFAAQAAIAIENARLLNELRQRTTDLTERTADLTEALEQQTATSEVLQVVSGSPGDLQPVFAAMLENAVRICGATFGNIFRWNGEAFHLVAAHKTPPAFAKARKASPLHPVATSHFGRLVKTKSVVHTPDLSAEQQYVEERRPAYVEAVELGGIKTFLAVPMLKDDELIGAFGLFRQEVRPFTDKQIALVTNFAAQAVIAIENARLLNELRQSLEQQTATSEVLQVISSSPGDLRPVFTTMLEKAVRISDAKFGTLYLYEEGGLRLIAAHDVPAAFEEVRGGGLIPPAPGGLFDEVIKTGTTVHLPDMAATTPYAEGHPRVVEAVELGGIRTVVAVPMLKENELIGIISIHRREVRPFTDKQIALVTNFAAQAVIAIENARLLNELRQRTTDLTEALEQQTATSNVLQVISSSPGNLEPVFATMLENAVRLCDAKFGSINRWDGEALHLVATYNVPPDFAEFRKRTPFRPGPENPISRMLMTKTVIHFHDLATEQGYIERNPTFVAAVELGGVRTFLAVPMLKENDLIGVVIVYRQEVRPFSDKQIEIVKNFAAQAVIAIENARLLNELRQSLEQQTATADVLKVVSRSTFDLQTVLKALVETAARLCNADMGCIVRPQGSYVQFMATFGFSQDFIDVASSTPIPPGRWTLSGRVMEEGRTVHIHDVLADTEYTFTAAQQVAGFRSGLGVPLMREGTPIGVINLWRSQVQPFTEKQIELVTTFAAQAVIAIENTRLLKELRDRTEEVEKLNQHLEQRVADQVGEIERMGRLRRFLPPQVADLIVASGSEKQLESHRREITALFCDLRGFTGFTESADAEDVMALLRDYHAAIGEIIIKYNGTLERYAGDGVMVVFNDPVPVENPALQAVLMALEVRDAIGALTETWRRWGTTLASASALRTASLRLAPSASRDVSTTPPSARCPTSPLGFAMRPSRGKSSSAREC